MRIDRDRGPHHHIPQMERASIRGNHDRETKRGSLIRPREIHPATRDRKRVFPRAHYSTRAPDPAPFPTRTLTCLRFPTQRDIGEVPKHPHRRMDRDPREILFTILTREFQHQRAIRPSRGAFRARRKPGSERHARGAHTAFAIPINPERRFGDRTRRERGAPRFKDTARRVCPARLRVSERGTRTFLELVDQFPERHLWIVREHGAQLARRQTVFFAVGAIPTRFYPARELDHGFAVDFDDQTEQLAFFSFRFNTRRLAFLTTLRLRQIQMAL